MLNYFLYCVYLISSHLHLAADFLSAHPIKVNLLNLSAHFCIVTVTGVRFTDHSAVVYNGMAVFVLSVAIDGCADNRGYRGIDPQNDCIVFLQGDISLLKCRILHKSMSRNCDYCLYFNHVACQLQSILKESRKVRLMHSEETRNAA